MLTFAPSVPTTTPVSHIKFTTVLTPTITAVDVATADSAHAIMFNKFRIYADHR